MEFVAEAPVFLALPAGAVLCGPGGFRVRDLPGYFANAVGVGMGPDGGAVDRDLLPKPRQELPELIGQRRETVGYQVVVGPEPADEPIEGAAVWERAAEAAAGA